MDFKRMSFGDCVRTRREELGLTQAEVGERIGTAAAYVSQIESGGTKWPKTYVPALAKALDVSERELAQWAGRMPSSTSINPLPPDDPRYRLIDLVLKVDPKSTNQTSVLRAIAFAENTIRRVTPQELEKSKGPATIDKESIR